MNMEMFDLTGKVALVTGATHGLGMAMAIGLGKAGAKLAIASHGTQQKMTEALSAYDQLGLDAKSYFFDVTCEVETNNAIEAISRDLGGIDILVNNAGIIQRTPLEEMSLSDFEKVIQVDLVSPFIVSKAVVKGMMERKQGKIINICSVLSELGRDHVGAYSSAKAGLKMLTQNMATEWAKHNIQVNGIGPGYFATSQTAPIRTDGHPFNEFIISRTPAARWGMPADLEGTVIFLASRASQFVNGQVIYVDGGLLASIGKPQNQ